MTPVCSASSAAWTTSPGAAASPTWSPARATTRGDRRTPRAPSVGSGARWNCPGRPWTKRGRCQGYHKVNLRCCSFFSYTTFFPLPISGRKYWSWFDWLFKLQCVKDVWDHCVPDLGKRRKRGTVAFSRPIGDLRWPIYAQRSLTEKKNHNFDTHSSFAVRSPPSSPRCSSPSWPTSPSVASCWATPPGSGSETRSGQTGSSNQLSPMRYLTNRGFVFEWYNR